MEIIKKNLILFIVLGITLVASIVLLVFVLIGHGEMMESVKKIDEIKGQITELQRQKPVPHKTNMVRINKDIDIYKQKINDVYHYFGFPYNDAYQAFVSTLGMSNDAFMTKFRDFWTQNAIRGSNIQQLYIKFLQSLDQDKLNKGRDIFRQIYQKQTLEKINDTNINDILFYAIGVNRPMSSSAAKAFLVGMQDEMLRLFDNYKIASNESVNTFTFSRYFGNEMPRAEDVPNIVEVSTIIGDVVTRIAESDIKRIDSITRGPLEGTADGKFIRYRINVDVVGEMGSLQKFVNNLADAYKVNRVYIVRNLTFEQLSDKVPEYTGEGLPNARTLTQKDELMPDSEKAKELEKTKKKKLAFNEERSYGKPVLGGGSPVAKLVKMTVEIDYVMFVREKFAIQE